MNSTGHRYIFCVSPGRSGSHYLQRVLACADDICAVHEPEHQYSEYAHLKPGRWNLKNMPFAHTAAERRRLKLDQINDLLARTGKQVYAETNPLFSTLWHDVLLDALVGQDVTVVILRRQASAVLKSLLDLGWFQGKDGNRWMVTCYSVNSLVEPITEEKFATPAELIISYLINVESYAERIRNRCNAQGYRVLELFSQQLFTDTRSIEELASLCSIELNRAMLHEIGMTGRNKSSIRKKIHDIPTSTCKQWIKDYFEMCRAKGIAAPDLHEE